MKIMNYQFGDLFSDYLKGNNSKNKIYVGIGICLHGTQVEKVVEDILKSKGEKIEYNDDNSLYTSDYLTLTEYFTQFDVHPVSEHISDHVSNNLTEFNSFIIGKFMKLQCDYKYDMISWNKYVPDMDCELSENLFNLFGIKPYCMIINTECLCCSYKYY